MTPEERAKRAMERPAEGAQRRLSGEEREAAMRLVRWLDPSVFEDRLALAIRPAGAHVPMWVPATSAMPKRKKIVHPWDQPEVADAARRRGGAKNKRRAA